MKCLAFVYEAGRDEALNEFIWGLWIDLALTWGFDRVIGIDLTDGGVVHVAGQPTPDPNFLYEVYSSWDDLRIAYPVHSWVHLVAPNTPDAIPLNSFSHPVGDVLYVLGPDTLGESAKAEVAGAEDIVSVETVSVEGAWSFTAMAAVAYDRFLKVG